MHKEWKSLLNKLALLLAMFCGMAFAEEWFEMPNEAGGKIILTLTKCENTETGKLVIATTPKGGNVMGCWYYFSDMVHIVWKNGQTSSFNPTDFTARKK